MGKTVLDIFTNKKENTTKTRKFLINITEIVLASIALVMVLIATYTCNNNHVKALLYVALVTSFTFLLDGYTSLRKEDN